MFEATGVLAPTLFGSGAPTIDTTLAELRRTSLGNDAWIDYAPQWLQGHETLFELLVLRAEWISPVVRMYDNDVQTPRLNARVEAAWHPIIGEIVEVLSARYRVRLDRVSAGLYRNGRDSVAWHGDRVARELPEATVATVSLGAPRRFLLRPTGGGRSIGFSLGFGDLVVMGGSCQRTWQHAVPKTSHAQARIALMFRHAYD